MWILAALSLFLKQLQLFVKLNYILLHIRIYDLFFLIVMDD